MIKVRIHLYNPQLLLDRSVYIEAYLPAIPTKGSMLYLSENEQISFEKQINKSKEKTKEYKIWVNSELSETMIINNIFYFTDQEHVSIEIVANSISIEVD